MTIPDKSADTPSRDRKKAENQNVLVLRFFKSG